jgi:hypothetical protein
MSLLTRTHVVPLLSSAVVLAGTLQAAHGGSVRITNVDNVRVIVDIHFVGNDPNGLAGHGWTIVDPTQAHNIGFPGERAWIRVQRVGNNNPVHFGNHQRKDFLMTGERHEIRVNPVDNAFRLLKWGPNLEHQFNWKSGERLPPGWGFNEHIHVDDGESLEITPR